RDIIIVIFAVKFLADAGYKLILEKCVFCEKPIPLDEEKKMSIQHGGVLCTKCRSRDVQAMDVSSLAVQYLKKIEMVDLTKLGKIKIENSIKNELKRIVHFYLSHHLPGRLKTEEFMEKLTSR
ncbi:MAG: DNA repair protein RecO, partial [Elusimicrobiota bacterium]|nr:DNA repair protein RecO [Elusimicrobiota bacterium]